MLGERAREQEETGEEDRRDGETEMLNDTEK